MEKIYQICFLFVNELEDIRMATTFEAAVRLLTKHCQILEFDVVDGLAKEIPSKRYTRNEMGDIVVHTF